MSDTILERQIPVKSGIKQLVSGIELEVFAIIFMEVDNFIQCFFHRFAFFKIAQQIVQFPEHYCIAVIFIILARRQTGESVYYDCLARFNRKRRTQGKESRPLRFSLLFKLHPPAGCSNVPVPTKSL